MRRLRGWEPITLLPPTAVSLRPQLTLGTDCRVHLRRQGCPRCTSTVLMANLLFMGDCDALSERQIAVRYRPLGVARDSQTGGACVRSYCAQLPSD